LGATLVHGTQVGLIPQKSIEESQKSAEKSTNKSYQSRPVFIPFVFFIARHITLIIAENI